MLSLYRNPAVTCLILGAGLGCLDSATPSYVIRFDPEPPWVVTRYSNWQTGPIQVRAFIDGVRPEMQQTAPLELKWTSADETVAWVAKPNCMDGIHCPVILETGFLMSGHNGTTTVTASWRDLSATAQVTVNIEGNN